MTLVLLVVLAGAPSVAVQEFAAPDFSADQRTLLTNLFAATMRKEGVKVVTQDEIVAVLGLERQRQLLNCSESNCTAELGAALGVEAMVLGRVGSISGTISVLAKLISTTNGEVLEEFTERLPKNGSVEEAVERAARRLGGRMAGKAAPSSNSLLLWSLAPALAGLGCVIAGTVLQVQVGQTVEALRGAPSRAEAEGFAARGRLEQGAAFGLIVGGSLALATGVVMAIVGLGKPPPVAVWFGPWGGGVRASFSFEEVAR